MGSGGLRAVGRTGRRAGGDGEVAEGCGVVRFCPSWRGEAAGAVVHAGEVEWSSISTKRLQENPKKSHGRSPGRGSGDSIEERVRGALPWPEMASNGGGEHVLR